MTASTSLDLGPHPSARTEWWYFTGRLIDQDEKEYFFMLGFFRSGLGIELSRSAHWLFHSASSDVGGFACERTISCFGDRAKIKTEGFAIDYDGWTVAFDGSRFQIRANCQSLALKLDVAAGYPIVSGRDGKIEIGRIRTNCRSFPRLSAEGEMDISGEIRKVRGVCWFDHEWGTLALPHRWDWWGINFDNGDDLVIRHVGNRGIANWRHADAQIETTDAVLTRPGRYWQNRRGAKYPVAWTIDLPGFDMHLEIEAEREGCETPFRLAYWEGPCRARGTARDAPMSGRGYMEMIGYNPRMVHFILTRLALLGRNLLFRNRPAEDIINSFPST